MSGEKRGRGRPPKARDPVLTDGGMDALAQLAGMTGPRSVGVRLVLVQGVGPSIAARQVGLSVKSLDNALRRGRAALALSRQASGLENLEAKA